jgi:glutamate carboxypeptidase
LPEIVADIEAVVSHESPSADLEAVSRCAACVAAIGAARLGREPDVLVTDGCTHLRWRGDAMRRRVLVLCHHDTVWPLGSLQRHPARTDDGILRGPGCLDMKAGVVMAFHALAAVGLDGVTLLVTGDEELGSPTSRTLIEAEARTCDATLVLEAAAAAGALKVERKGRARYELTITGRAAHAGLEPDRGVNAVVELARQVLAVQALADPAAGTTVTPSLVAGGTAANTVPGQASFSVDVRSTTTAELERVDAAIRALQPTLAEARIVVGGGIESPPFERSASAALFDLAARLAPTIGLGELRGASVGGGSDGNLTAALGVPTLDGLGAVGDGIHAAHEHVVVDELPGRTALVALLVDRLVRDEAVVS